MQFIINNISEGRKMNYRENLFIFSVYQVGVKQADNELNHSFVKTALTNSGISFKEVLGMYKGHEEMAFVVLGLKNETYVETYCQLFEQESYLMVHNDQTADLKFLTDDGIKVERLGKFVPVPDSVNVNDLDGWSKDLSSGGYFYITKE